LSDKLVENGRLLIGGRFAGMAVSLLAVAVAFGGCLSQTMMTMPKDLLQQIADESRRTNERLDNYREMLYRHHHPELSAQIEALGERIDSMTSQLTRRIDALASRIERMPSRGAGR